MLKSSFQFVPLGDFGALHLHVIMAVIYMHSTTSELDAFVFFVPFRNLSQISVLLLQKKTLNNKERGFFLYILSEFLVSGSQINSDTQIRYKPCMHSLLFPSGASQ